MPIKLSKGEDLNQPTVYLSGKLTRADYEQFAPEFERLVTDYGQMRALIIMDDFHGWKVSAAWEDLKIVVKHAASIERLAVVGEKKWQQGMTTFCKPFTKAKVRYFEHSAAEEARIWLSAEAA